MKLSMEMSNRILYTKLSSVVAVMLALSSCADWTTPESIDFGTQSKYDEAYLSSLRAYKSGSHKVMIVGMDGVQSHPVSRSQHIMAMPDSADYITVRNIGGLFPDIASEIGEVRSLKGTKVICEIDYMQISSVWQEMEDERKENGEKPGTEEEYITFMSDRIATELARCDEYALDGVMASYQLAFSSYENTGRELFVNALKEWKSSHQSKDMLFKGMPINIMDEEFISNCRYLIIPLDKLYSPGEFTRTVSRGCRHLPDNDKQKIMVEVHVPCDEYPLQGGDNPQPQPEIAAEWTMEDDPDYKRNGIYVANVKDDYTPISTFSVTRKSISIMNKIL